jgi:hypothetical protein
VPAPLPATIWGLPAEMLLLPAGYKAVAYLLLVYGYLYNNLVMLMLFGLADGDLVVYLN